MEERKLTSQPPSITAEFSVQYNLKITSLIHLVIYIKIGFAFLVTTMRRVWKKMIYSFHMFFQPI